MTNVTYGSVANDGSFFIATKSSSLSGACSTHVACSKIRKPSVLSKALKLAGEKAEFLREALCEEQSIVVPR
jgi:hypothetical protein